MIGLGSDKKRPQKHFDQELEGIGDDINRKLPVFCSQFGDVWLVGYKTSQYRPVSPVVLADSHYCYCCCFLAIFGFGAGGVA